MLMVSRTGPEEGFCRNGWIGGYARNVLVFMETIKLKSIHTAFTDVSAI